MDLFLAASLLFLTNAQAPQTTQLERDAGRGMVVAAADVAALGEALQKRDSVVKLNGVPSFLGRGVTFALPADRPGSGPRHRR